MDSIIFLIIIDVLFVISDGLIITELLAEIALIRDTNVRLIGKFHGVIISTTPFA